MQCKMLVYFMAIWYILRTFGIFCGHLVYFMVIWYFFPVWYVAPRKNLATLVGALAKLWKSSLKVLWKCDCETCMKEEVTMTKMYMMPLMVSLTRPGQGKFFFFYRDQLDCFPYFWLQGSYESTRNLDHHVPTFLLEHLNPCLSTYILGPT
jgi:hypothetical protein